MSSGVIHLNSDSYLNHLSPREAMEYETARNIILVSLGASIWDIFATLPDDIRVLRRSRLRITTICFICSRLFALAALVISSLNRRTIIPDMRIAVITSVILHAISLGCSSYLFLQRTLAVYADSPRVRRFFAILWMAYIGSELLLVFAVKPAYIPKTQHFKHSGVQPLQSLTAIVIILYDSLVFLAISYKIGIAHVVIDREMGWGRFISGKALPRLSQAVLRGGQQYFLIVCIVILPSGIFLYVPSTPPIFKSMITVLWSPLMAVMACRAHRNIKLFEYDVTPPYPISEIQFV